MTLRKMKKAQDILETMIIHENGLVSYRGFISYDAIIAYRERNKRDKVIIEKGTIS